MIDEFWKALFELKGNDYIVFAQFRGDPNEDARGKWRVRVLRDPERDFDSEANVYVCVSAMRRNARGEIRRRKENFGAGMLLMIDDIGEGTGSKFPPSLLDAARPTAMIETSPGNFQATYLFREPERDIELMDALIRGFIDKQFLGVDPGSGGVNRVFRPPAGINAKPRARGWPVRLAEWNGDARYTPTELARAFGIDLVPRNWQPRTATLDVEETAAAWLALVDLLESADMIKGGGAVDLGGWVQVRCPWTAEHSGRAETGAALRVPAEENGWVGGFRCHHGGCRDRGMRELTDWAAEAAAEVMNDVNRSWSNELTMCEGNLYSPLAQGSR